MKIIKVLFLFATISLIVIGCKETKKEDVNSEMDAVEEVEEAEAMEEVEQARALEEVEAVEAASEEMEVVEIEGVIVEAAADTPVIYPGCGGSSDEIRACSREAFIKFLGDNFDSGLSKDLSLDAGEHKIRAMVKIDETGKSSVIKVDAPHEDLEKEVVRVINELPQMTAATVGGSAVSVSFVLPLNFEVK